MFECTLLEILEKMQTKLDGLEKQQGQSSPKVNFRNEYEQSKYRSWSDFNIRNTPIQHSTHHEGGAGITKGAGSNMGHTYN